MKCLLILVVGMKELYNVMFKVLQEHVPEASEDQLHHQLEYLGIRVEEGSIVLIGGSYASQPSFVGPFYRKEKELKDLILQRLKKAYEKKIGSLNVRVVNAIHELKDDAAVPDSIWLRSDTVQLLPLGHRFFLDLRIHIHGAKEEFVMALRDGRVVEIQKEKD